MKSIILDLHNKLINDEISIAELVNQSQKLNNQYKYTNATLADNYHAAAIESQQKEKSVMNHVNDLLFGIPYSLKDLICTKKIITTGGSKFLKDYLSPYDAQVYKILQKAGGILVSKANCDEYGMGGTGLDSGLAIVSNPIDKQRIVGGSSSGSAVHVYSGIVPFSIGTDTGDSVRSPASYMGLVGYKPTYGLVSRYGCIPYAPSMDHIGIISKYVADAAIVASKIVAYDEKDFTSQKINDREFFKNLKKVENVKFCVLKGIEELMDENVKMVYTNYIDNLKQKFIVVEYNLDIKIIKALSPVYMSLTYAEAASCHANKTSIQFGLSAGGHGYEEIIINARTNGFGNQVKRRMTIGSYITSSKNFEKLYQRSKKVRTLIIDEMKNIFAIADCLILPGNGSIAPLIKELESNNISPNTKLVSDLLMLANFSGCPSITIPCSKIDDMPIGINITTNIFKDQLVFDIAYTLEELNE
ncbi:aspartyl/glutamyl-tRNA amidotransferase subunit A [Bacilli bacterium]|nr:aspartyl/glutamyl-tRNA amidotransferase subunit A [Bacilli bacterium]